MYVSLPVRTIFPLTATSPRQAKEELAYQRYCDYCRNVGVQPLPMSQWQALGN